MRPSGRKPSALTERDGTIYENPSGLDLRVVNKTLEEADHGRAYDSQLDPLGSYVLVDYVRNKRRVVRG